MKNEMKDLAKKTVEDFTSKPISRKAAIKKTGYMALSAATMMVLLSNPANARGREERGGRHSNRHRHSGGGPSTSHSTN
jgi:hypothetical protein